jgi:G3E family GTPase
MYCIVIGGFLGSGKTTLVNHLIRATEETEQVAMLINEFGDIPVDSAIIERRNFAMQEITGGCICCTLKGKLKDAVEDIQQNISPDRLLIETTGLAVPEEIIQDLTQIEGVRTSGILCIDPEQYRPLAGKLEIYNRQLRNAKLIYLTKTDIRDQELINETENRCMAEQPETLILTDYSQLLKALMFRTEPSRFKAVQKISPILNPLNLSESAADETGINQVTVPLKSPVNPAGLEKNCHELSEAYNSELYRLKGIISTENGPAVFHFIDETFSLQTLEEYPGNNSFAVVIADSGCIKRFPPADFFS